MSDPTGGDAEKAVPPPPKLPEVESPSPEEVLQDVPSPEELLESDEHPSVDEIIGGDSE
ncbi:MAG TPA: hypothetical protein VF529_20390 [Solirubrobacteraceae bacterium]|jgi:hypothetical protein